MRRERLTERRNWLEDDVLLMQNVCQLYVFKPSEIET